MNFIQGIFLIFVFSVQLTLPVFSQKVNNENDLLISKKPLNFFILSQEKSSFLLKEDYNNRFIQLVSSQKLVGSEPLNLSHEAFDRKIEMKALLKAKGANLRIIDKIYGTAHEIKVFNYSELTYQTLRIGLHECFYDIENLRTESIALLRISDNQLNEGSYDGWMSSRYSHLTNYNNYRYSLWLLSCIISNQE